MNRDKMLSALRSTQEWDFVIPAAAARLGSEWPLSMPRCSGYPHAAARTLMTSRKATSSRSTKLVHGGVRYLRQGNISLVLPRPSCERVILLIKNASHLVQQHSLRRSELQLVGRSLLRDRAEDRSTSLPDGRDSAAQILLSRKKTLRNAADDRVRKGSDGGVIYYDGQFDDARLAGQSGSDGGGAGRDTAELLPA